MALAIMVATSEPGRRACHQGQRRSQWSSSFYAYYRQGENDRYRDNWKLLGNPLGAVSSEPS
jgi:hypothetical protein